MKLLLADDERLARTLLEGWLTNWGYEVTCVDNGEAALEALKAPSGPQLALLDWVMPKLDGLDVCRLVREHRDEPYVYMVLLTARDDKEHIVQGLEAGADDYLVKPCNPVELKLRLRAGRRLIELQNQLVLAREALRYEARHDSLTGLLNRGAILPILENELTRCIRSRSQVSVLLVDLDHFKSVNDTHGHGAGDEVLRKAATCLQTAVRDYDTVGRLGGEEFLIVLPDCDSRLGMLVAERVRRLLSAEMVPTDSGAVRVTASIGVAGTDQHATTASETLIQAADSALYRAKAGGRNRAMLATGADWQGMFCRSARPDAAESTTEAPPASMNRSIA